MSTECVQDVNRLCTRCQHIVYKMSTDCVQDVSRLCTICQQTVYKMSTDCVQDVNRRRTRCQQTAYKMPTDHALTCSGDVCWVDCDAVLKGCCPIGLNSDLQCLIVFTDIVRAHLKGPLNDCVDNGRIHNSHTYIHAHTL